MDSDKYTFRREYTDMYGRTRVIEHKFESESLNEIVEDFLWFLNGCSFSYVKDLIYVTENGEEAVLDYSYSKSSSDSDTIVLSGFDDMDTMSLHDSYDTDITINAVDNLDITLTDLENKFKS